MKKIPMIALGLASLLSYAQSGRPQLNGRVGINTDTPRATLDIVGRPISPTDKMYSRGIVLPHISDEEKSEFTDKTEGLVIWNTTKKCIDYWDGVKWQCTEAKSYSATKIFYSNLTFVKDNCPEGGVGSSVQYSNSATATVVSTESQEDADNRAMAEAERKYRIDGQIYANANGYCTYTATMTYNGSATFTRDNCPSGATAGTITYNTPTEGTATSTISQADANAKALAQAEANFNRDGQNQANATASCTYTGRMTYEGNETFTRNNCEGSAVGGTYTYVASVVGEATSTISQADADNKALELAKAKYRIDGQNQANATASCTYTATKTYNGSATFRRNNCPSGATGGTITYNTSTEGTATSTISQDDANAKALAQAEANFRINGQNQANATASCTYTATKTYNGSATFTRNNCPSGKKGGTITYNTPTQGTATSTISQDDANAKALAQAEANFRINGQNQANTQASCTEPIKLVSCDAKGFPTSPLLPIDVTNDVYIAPDARKIEITINYSTSNSKYLGSFTPKSGQTYRELLYEIVEKENLPIGTKLSINWYTTTISYTPDRYHGVCSRVYHNPKTNQDEIIRTVMGGSYSTLEQCMAKAPNVCDGSFWYFDECAFQAGGSSSGETVIRKCAEVKKLSE